MVTTIADASYQREYDFSGFQASNPNTPLPAGSIDNEFINIEAAMGALARLFDAEAAAGYEAGALAAMTRAETAADSAEADAVSTAADALSTAADAVSTAADAVSTAADAVATAADRVQTGLDRVATAADAVSTAADAASTADDAAATAADRVQTGLDRVAAAASAVDAGTITGTFTSHANVKAAGLPAGTVVNINGEFWQLKSGDYSAEVTADVDYEGCFFADGTIASTSGAWVRVIGDKVLFDWFEPTADGTTDDSDKLQKALTVAKLKGRPLRVTDGDYAIDVESGVVLTDDMHIVLNNGAILRAIPNGGGYNTSHQTGILIVKGSNVTIRGGQLIGDREDHDYAANGGGTHEFGHGIYIYAQTETISDILIDRVSIIDCPGDSIQLFGVNSGGLYYYPNRVTIQNCLLQDCRRNNISVSVGQNTIVKHNRVFNAGITKYTVAGTPPKAGIDVEGGSCPLNTTVESNLFIGNVGGSIIFYNGNRCKAINNTCDTSIYYQWSANTLIMGNIIQAPAGSDAGIEQTTGYITTQTSGYQLAIGSRFEIVSRTTLDFTTVGSADNTVGTQFIATAVGPLSTGDSVRRIVENINIADNKISGGAGAAISSSGMTRNTTIADNHILYNTGTGIFVGNQAGASGSVGGEFVKGNNLYRCATGIRSSGKLCSIVENRIEECSSRSIYAPSTADGGECARNLIINPGDATNASVNMTGGAWTITANEWYPNNATVTAAYAAFVQDTGCIFSDNVVHGGTFGTAVFRTTYGADFYNNKVIACNAPKIIQCSAATGVNGTISGNYLESAATGTQYIIHLYGGGSGWRIHKNELGNGAATPTAAIDTSANTTSHISGNLLNEGAINADPTDVVRDFDGIARGSVTVDADASTTVSNPAVTATSTVRLIPKNASAATLLAGSSSLFVNPSNNVAGTSFQIDTADGGSAAGTESFAYEIAG